MPECCSPELLHPESAAGPAASGSAAGPAVPGLLPLPLLGSEFSRILAEYLPASVELALLDPLLLPPPKLVERCYLTATQGVTWLTCIIRVLLPSQLDTAGPGGAAGVSSPGSAASGTCCRSYRPSPCPNHHWEVRIIFLYLANFLLLPPPLMGIEAPPLLYISHDVSARMNTPPPNVHCIHNRYSFTKFLALVKLSHVRASPLGPQGGFQVGLLPALIVEGCSCPKTYNREVTS